MDNLFDTPTLQNYSSENQHFQQQAKSECSVACLSKSQEAAAHEWMMIWTLFEFISIYTFKNSERWPKKHPYLWSDIGHRSNRRRYHRAERRAPRLPPPTQLWERLCAKVKLALLRGGKMVNLSSFAFQTNPTEQFNNFKKYIDRYLASSSICFKLMISMPPTSASTMTPWLSPLTFSTSAKNCKFLQIFHHWNWREAAVSRPWSFSLNSQAKASNAKISHSKNPNTKTLRSILSLS